MAVGADLDVKQSYEPGSTPRIPRTNLQKVDGNLKKIHLNGPMGSHEIPVPPIGDFVLPALNQVGVYRTDPPVPQYERLAVNLLDLQRKQSLAGGRTAGRSDGRSDRGVDEEIAAGVVVVDRRLCGAAVVADRVVGLHAAGAFVITASR